MYIFLHCVGLNGKSPNFYSYVLNNPLVSKDPTGKILLPLAGSALLNVGFYLYNTPAKDRTIGGCFYIILVALLCTVLVIVLPFFNGP